MNVWQLSMAIGLALSAAGSLFVWSKMRRHVRRSPWGQPRAVSLMYRSGWLIAAIPVSEAFVLFMGGFWS